MIWTSVTSLNLHLTRKSVYSSLNLKPVSEGSSLLLEGKPKQDGEFWSDVIRY